MAQRRRTRIASRASARIEAEQLWHAEFDNPSSSSGLQRVEQDRKYSWLQDHPLNVVGTGETEVAPLSDDMKRKRQEVSSRKQLDADEKRDLVDRGQYVAPDLQEVKERNWDVPAWKRRKTKVAKAKKLAIWQSKMDRWGLSREQQDRQIARSSRY